jgi:ribosome-associated translation inhibitor RaiA
MRVYVSSPTAAINPQILTYAEYRIFAALSRYPEVRVAQVVLVNNEPARTVRCSVTVEDSHGSTRGSVKGSSAVGAIDRAAERVSQLMRRRFQPEMHPRQSETIRRGRYSGGAAERRVTLSSRRGSASSGRRAV